MALQTAASSLCGLCIDPSLPLLSFLYCAASLLSYLQPTRQWSALQIPPTIWTLPWPLQSILICLFFSTSLRRITNTWKFTSIRLAFAVNSRLLKGFLCLFFFFEGAGSPTTWGTSKSQSKYRQWGLKKSKQIVSANISLRAQTAPMTAENVVSIITLVLMQASFSILHAHGPMGWAK